MTRSSAILRDLNELLGSMRFAISSLSILGIASIIGTLLRQREPFPNYVNQFGPFWAELFQSAGIYEVYNAWWFVLVLAFLVVSTSLCVLRNTPKFLREMRVWRENIRTSSLRAFHHHAEGGLAQPDHEAARAVGANLRQMGYGVRIDARDGGTMVTARRGATNRLGYILTHLGIVVVCLGGLLDSELPVRTVVALMDKSPIPPGPLASDQIGPEHRLPAANPSYRASILIPEGQSADIALVGLGEGTLVQPLPFTIELERFRVDYYSNGMPKLFASDVVVVDKATGERRAVTIEVNKPLIQDGIAVYQSSFDDGGSRVKLRALPLDGSARQFTVDTRVGESTPLARGGDSALTLEITGFRAINVENMATARAGGPGDAAQNESRFRESVATVLSPSGAASSRDLRNVGPSVQYKLRDTAGQAREFHVYMLPMELDGDAIFLAGMRDDPNDQFRFMRLPADEDGSLNEFMRLRVALADPDSRARAAARFAARAVPQRPDGTPDPALLEQLTTSAERSLETFATGGLQAIADFVERHVPVLEHERAAEMFIRLLSGSLWDLWQVAREDAGLAPVQPDERHGRFLQLSQNALSDIFVFGAPMLFQLEDFEQVQASVFQLTRSPGKYIVYGGCLMLVLGIFAMFYIRERRVWCWLGRSGPAETRALLAMSATRRTLALDADFAAVRAAVFGPEPAASAADDAAGPGRSGTARPAP